MKKFTINIKKWYRGNGADSGLLIPDGTMCCVGQIARQCGIPKSNILGVATADGIGGDGNLDKFKNGLGIKKVSSAWIRKAYETNDNDSIDDATRMKRLKSIFKKRGIQLVFK